MARVEAAAHEFGSRKQGFAEVVTHVPGLANVIYITFPAG
jgi:hypothetical protein